MTNNYNDLKQLFDAECKVAEQMVKGAPSHRSEYSVACVIVRLLQGHSIRSSYSILKDAYRIIDTLKADADLDTSKVYQIKMPI